eukprot:CAMPEP_0197567982 /NCGR_PEP_ID=MMETSP1320-20131121/36558_1 /TAXON_ID=91990 /ORGANISM="Bolidomonas sp., Strain RCC2347" /LENGTH=213 /DNA_ID=CAMNT_0043130227 /DNA_START=13 /DNA_END=651 /DNA_ORIENTATION=+
MKKRRSTAKGDKLLAIAQRDPEQAKEELKKSLAEVAYDDISASFLWGQGPNRQESDKFEPDKRRSVQRMDSQGDRPESYNPDVATSLHMKHALSSVKEGDNVLMEEINIEEGGEGRESSSLKRPVIFKGNLLKKSPSMFKGWQKRFVAISERMTYSLEEGADEKGEVSLVAAKGKWKVDKLKNGSSSYELSIVPTLPPSRVFQFKTDSEMDKE